jgi:hypothetical protein
MCYNSLFALGCCRARPIAVSTPIPCLAGTHPGGVSIILHLYLYHVTLRQMMPCISRWIHPLDVAIQSSSNRPMTLILGLVNSFNKILIRSLLRISLAPLT